MNKKGSLVLIGGNEDKTRNKEVLKEIVQVNQAKKVVIVPSASKYYPRQLGEKYQIAFRDLGAETIDVLDIRSREEADKEEHFKLLNDAECIFFTGGDQVRLVEMLSETKLLYLIKQRYENGCTLAGTSAGAAAASNPMIYDGDEMGFLKGSVNHTEGFGFIENITIDTHFLVRGRIARLAQFLLRGYSDIGIGIAEDTAIIYSPKETIRVVGNGMITLINSKNLQYTDYQQTKIDEQFTSDGYTLSFLAPEAIYDLKKCKIIQ